MNGNSHPCSVAIVVFFVVISMVSSLVTRLRFAPTFFCPCFVVLCFSSEVIYPCVVILFFSREVVRLCLAALCFCREVVHVVVFISCIVIVPVLPSFRFPSQLVWFASLFSLSFASASANRRFSSILISLYSNSVLFSSRHSSSHSSSRALKSLNSITARFPVSTSCIQRQ